jgi:branched-chain amino acid transport system permease protein
MSTLAATGRRALEDRQRLLALAAFPAVIVIGAVLDMDIFYAAVLGALLAARALFTGDHKIALGLTIALGVWAVLLPFFHSSGGGFIDDAVLALAYSVFALGLNIVVGFAGLLDLGYVAFFALGALTAGWLMSGFFADANVHIAVGSTISNLPGVHVNFLIVIVAAIAVCTVAGMIIGLPTLRLRGDYIAIVTLAFGEIIGRIVLNGDEIKFGSTKLTNGRQGITPVDKIKLPGLDQFEALNLRPWFWTALAMVALALFVNFRLRDSRLGRAWIALREDEVAAASMGVPLVRVKLLAYGTGAAFGGMSGAFIASYLNTVNADQFQFSFSIFVLAMVILGGLGSIWGVVIGAITLSFINNRLIPDVLNDLPSKVGLNFDLTELSFGIFGFLLVIMMILRPEGLFPERRRKLELAEGVGVGATTGVGTETREPAAVFEAKT